MRSIYLVLCSIFVLSYAPTLSAQCTDYLNGPFPVPEMPPCGDDVCGNPIFIPAPPQPSTAWLFEDLIAGNTYEFSLCNSGLPIAPQNMELVVVDQFNNILASTTNCVIQFTPDADGDYLVIFNILDSCGQPSTLMGEGFEVQLLCPAPCPPDCFLNRQEAVQALLDPLSGFEFDSQFSNLWSPFLDFGFGPGFEGLVPQGTTIRPFSGAPAIVTPTDGYFFWVDDLPQAEFIHPTRFVFLDATNCAPTLSNGGILITEERWWPELILPDDTVLDFFRIYDDRLSDFPPDPLNPDGLIEGNVASPDDVVVPEDNESTPSSNLAAGLVVSGDTGSNFETNSVRWKNDLEETYGVDSARIVCPNSGNGATIQQFCDGIDDLVNMMPMPDKIYIRISSHGEADSLLFTDGKLHKSDLCDKFKEVAKKGVPIHLIINACESEGLLDANNWNFPAGSTIITSAAAGSFSWGGTFWETDENGDTIPGSIFSGSLLPYSHTKCLNDETDSDDDGNVDADTNEDGTVDECEAFRWVESQKPCYVWVTNNRPYYPAGPPEGAMGANPMPSIRKVGNFSDNMNFNVQNNSGGDKDQFCMVFQGNVSGGSGFAWTSDAGDNISGTWANGGNVTSTYDAQTDETTVCWMASGDDAGQGEFVHFGYTAPDDKQLRPVRQYWTNSNGNNANGMPTKSMSIPDSDKVPTTESDIYLDGSGGPLTVNTINRDLAAGGWGEAVDYVIGYRIAPAPIPLADLSLGNSAVSALDYVAVHSGTLAPDSDFKFDIDIPEEMKVGEVLILQVELSWSLNGNTNDQLIQWSPLDAASCIDDILYTAASSIPDQTNSSGMITLDGVTVSGGKTTFNAKENVTLLPGTTLQNGGSEIHLYTYGCDGSAPASVPSAAEEHTSIEAPIALMQAPSEFDIAQKLPFQIFPNPFSERLTITYELPKATEVQLAIYDLHGKEVARVVNGIQFPEGKHTLEFTGGNLPEGIYIATLRAGDWQEQLKLVKVK